MKKHFFFTTKLDYKSGWGTNTLNYIKELNKKDVVVFCAEISSKQKFKQYKVLSQPLNYLKNPINIFFDYIKVKKILKKYNNFKLYSHFTVEPYSLLLVFIKNFFFINIFYGIGSYAIEISKNFKTKFFFLLAKKHFHKIIYISEYSKKNIEDNVSFKHVEETRIINPTINLNIKLKKKKFKTFTILSVGAIKPRKGYEYLIEVLRKINCDYNKKFNLKIIGKINDINYSKRINHLIKKYKLSNNVEILNNVNEKDIFSYYNNSHIFVLLSKKINNYFEGFGIVYLEALNFSLPIIISKESGGRDLLKLNRNLKTFNPSDINSIAIETIKLVCKKNHLNLRKILKKHQSSNLKKLKNFYKNLK
tara:strand:- start:64 stop:1152 length:1089 start_codon:yes stop_codon:yes gene_type:complete